MDIRPQDLPELRAELSQQVTDLKFFRPMLDRLKDPSQEGMEAHASAYRQLVDESDLYYVAAPMTELVTAAADSLSVFSPNRDDLPSQQGLIIFNGDLKQHLHMHDGHTPALRGVLWGSSGNLPCFMIAPVADKHEGVPTPGQLVTYPSLAFRTNYGEHIKNANLDETACENIRLLALLLTAALLMRQSLAENTEAGPDRAARKRLRRAGQEPKPVRVIELRRPKSSGAPGGGESNYHHQWIVKGHWRQHWYPKREVHRPVWIAPHIKGPEGAPLIGGEKVYALKR